jgi:hypothetical protein
MRKYRASKLGTTPIVAMADTDDEDEDDDDDVHDDRNTNTMANRTKKCRQRSKKWRKSEKSAEAKAICYYSTAALNYT